MAKDNKTVDEVLADDPIWRPATDLWKQVNTNLNADTAKGLKQRCEHLFFPAGFRIQYERCENGGTRIVLADPDWMRENRGYEKRSK